jgi:rhamnose transport system permease protein
MEEKRKVRLIGLDDARSFKRTFLRWEWMLVILFIAVNVMNMSISKNYLNATNLASTMKVFLDKGIIAVSMTMVLLLGEIDISVGSIMALSGTIMGLVGSLGGGFIEILAAGIATGALCGFFNGFLVTRFKELDSTIITLTNSIFFRGIAYVILENRAYADYPDAVKYMSWGNLFGLPFILVFFIIEVIGISYLVHCTKFGRSLYAMGRNNMASLYSGIKTNRIKILVFMMNGIAASISGLFLISKLASARASMANHYDMDIIAMVILGGVSVSGGKGTVFGVAIAVFIIGLLRYGLGLINVSSEALMIIIGALLILLVAIPNLKTFYVESPLLHKLVSKFKKEKAA